MYKIGLGIYVLVLSYFVYLDQRHWGDCPQFTQALQLFCAFSARKVKILHRPTHFFFPRVPRVNSFLGVEVVEMLNKM